MKEKLQGLTAGILIGALSASGITFAKSAIENIEVSYDNIKVYKDNVLCDLKDANGSTVEPFIYNGTTYMPVRGTASLAGMDVTWDGTTKSVYLWDKISANNTLLMDVCPPYDGCYMSTDDFYMAGERYSGFTITRGGYALVNLNGKYSSLNMVIGPKDDCSILDTAIVNIILDGKKVNSYKVGTTDYPIETSIPLYGALQMKIEIEADYNTTQIGFGNITLSSNNNLANEL